MTDIRKKTFGPVGISWRPGIDIMYVRAFGHFRFVTNPLYLIERYRQRARLRFDEFKTRTRTAFYNSLPGIRVVNVYRVTQEYGGPEEGGWFYDWYDCLESRACLWFQAEKVREKLERKHAHEHQGMPGQILGGNPDDLDSTEDFEENDMTGVLTAAGIEVSIEKVPAEYQTTARPYYE